MAASPSSPKTRSSWPTTTPPEYPPRSTGVLSHRWHPDPRPIVDIVTDRTTEYDIQSFEPSFSAIRIGDEIIKYTTVATITGGVRLSA